MANSSLILSWARIGVAIGKNLSSRKIVFIPYYPQNRLKHLPRVKRKITAGTSSPHATQPPQWPLPNLSP